MGGNGVSDSDEDDGGGDIIVYMISNVIFKIVHLIYKYTVAAYSCLQHDTYYVIFESIKLLVVMNMNEGMNKL